MGKENPHNRKPVFDGESVHVMSERCETCIFNPKGSGFMWLEAKRLKEMIEGSIRENAAITCHKTIYEPGYTQLAICRGFWDGYADRVPTLRLAINLGVVKETDGRE